MSNYPKWSGIVAFVVTLAMCGAVVQAQQTEKVRRIGFLDNSTASSSEVRLEAFRQQLRKLGWIEGKSITIDYRFAERKPEHLPALAWTALPDGRIDYYNRRWYEYTGTTWEQMQGWGWREVHDPAVLPRVEARWAASRTWRIIGLRRIRASGLSGRRVEARRAGMTMMGFTAATL